MNVCLSVVFLPSCLSDIACWLTYADKGDADIYDHVDVDVDVDVDVAPLAFPLFCLSGSTSSTVLPRVGPRSPSA